MEKKQPWGFKQFFVASLLTAFVLGGLGVYIYTLAQYRESVSQLKAVEKQYAEYQALQERRLKYQRQYELERGRTGVRP